MKRGQPRIAGGFHLQPQALQQMVAPFAVVVMAGTVPRKNPDGITAPAI